MKINIPNRSHSIIMGIQSVPITMRCCVSCQSQSEPQVSLKAQRERSFAANRSIHTHRINSHVTLKSSYFINSSFCVRAKMNAMNIDSTHCRYAQALH